MKLSKLKSDIKKENHGVWIDYNADIKFKIARIGSTEYNKVMEELTLPHKKALRRGALPDTKFAEIMSTALATGCILDWSGIEDDDGKLIPFSVDKAVEWMNDASLKDLRDFIAKEASNIENFRLTDIEEDKDLIKK